MLQVAIDEKGVVLLSGRWDASQSEKAQAVFTQIDDSKVVDFAELDYISSAGLSILLATQKRLNDSGKALKLINLNKYITDVFRYAGFDTVFEIS